MSRRTTSRTIIWAGVAALVLLILLAMRLPPFAGEVSGSEALAYALIPLLAGGAFELWRWLGTHGRVYRIAFSVGLLGALLLAWVNGAVGIIGSEDNPANLMFGAVYAVGLVGALASRFRPRGLARTALAAAAVQVMVPVVALWVSPDVSWGDAGVGGVMILNALLASVFVVSALL